MKPYSLVVPLRRASVGPTLRSGSTLGPFLRQRTPTQRRTTAPLPRHANHFAPRSVPLRAEGWWQQRPGRCELRTCGSVRARLRAVWCCPLQLVFPAAQARCVAPPACAGMASQLYRGSTVGSALTDALDEMVCVFAGSRRRLLTPGRLRR